MGYSIHIGNVVMVDRYDEYEYSQWSTEVEKVEMAEAPAWPNPEPEEGKMAWLDVSGKTNGRHHGYCQMSEWAEAVGLKELWFGEEDGLLKPHPGCAVLRPRHLEAVREARAKYQREKSDAVPGWRDGKDASLARLMWYEWWFAWALENCERPGVQNG
jgi:hypothetical protein